MFLDGFPYCFQRIVVGFFLVAVAGYIGDAEVGEDGVLLQEGTQGAGFLYAGDHPEGMLEHVPIFLIGKGIVAVGVIVGDEVEEGFHVGFMYEVFDVGALR